jgi:hypothetical protein
MKNEPENVQMQLPAECLQVLSEAYSQPSGSDLVS